MICQATERAILLWLLRQGSTGSHGLDMNPVTAVTTLATFLNVGALVKTGQTTFQTYAYVGEEEERKKLPSLTVVCQSGDPEQSEPGNYRVNVEVEFRCNASSRPDNAGDAESDVITLIEAAGRWLEEMLSREESTIVNQIDAGHEWCTVYGLTQRARIERFVDKNVRGLRASFQLYASLQNRR